MAEGDICEIRIETRGSSRSAISTFGFISISAVETWREILVQGFYDGIMPQWLAGLTETVELRHLVCVDVVPGTGVDLEPDYSGINTGLLPGPTVSPQVAGLLLRWCDLQGRAYRGKSFVYGMPAANLDAEGRVWDFDAQDSLEDINEVLMESYGPAGTSTFGRLAVISRHLAGALRDPPIATPVTRVDFSGVVATMRRRVGRS